MLHSPLPASLLAFRELGFGALNAASRSSDVEPGSWVSEWMRNPGKHIEKPENTTLNTEKIRRVGPVLSLRKLWRRSLDSTWTEPSRDGDA